MPPTASTSAEHPTIGPSRPDALLPNLQMLLSYSIGRIARLATLVVMALLVATPARAVVRSCVPDGVANTADVLCAAPSGPCDASTVRITANIQIPEDVFCTFDLEDRTLIVNRTVEIVGSRGFLFSNAGDVTVTASGKLKARGDFNERFGFTEGGGIITVASGGTITIDGAVDVAGDPAGLIDLVADDDVIVGRTGTVLGRGISSFLDEGARFADGGDLDIRAGGDIVIEGELVFSSQSLATGGTIFLAAIGDVAIARRVDLRGGDSDGGQLDIFAGDDVTITASVDADSEAGGGNGGSVSLTAGHDDPGDRKVGGDLTITGARFTLRGHGVDDFGGDGGELEGVAAGDVFVSDVVVRADASTSFDASGGVVAFSSLSGQGDAIDELDGDMVVDAVISATGSRDDSFGGELCLDSGRDLTLRGSVTLVGHGGGEVDLYAGGDITSAAPILAHASSPEGDAGGVFMEAGRASVGTLRVTRKIVTAGGPLAEANSASTDLRGCRVVVDEAVKIETGAGQPGSSVRISSREPMLLGARSRFFAGPQGSIETRHPPGADPVVGPNVVFNPARTDVVVLDDEEFPACPASVCGNGIVEGPEQCDDGNVVAGDGCSPFCRLQCTEVPGATCRRKLQPGLHGRLALERRSTTRSRLTWLWLKGEATSIADFGDPTTMDPYVLCVYDESGASPVPIMRAAVPPGDRCGFGPCWQRNAHGFSFSDYGRQPDGIEALSLTAGADGDASVRVVGNGALLQLPPLPLALPLRVQLQTQHGECWESVYSTATRNDGRRFQAWAD